MLRTSHLSQICLSVGTTIIASGTLFSLVMVGRAIFIFSLANVANCFTRRSNAKIDVTSQVSTFCNIKLAISLISYYDCY